MTKHVKGDAGILFSQLDELLGRRALLKGESRTRYLELRNLAEGLMEPKDVFDAIEVQEIVDNIWDSQRFQNLAAKLVDAEFANALKYLTDSAHGYVSQKTEAWIKANRDKAQQNCMTDLEFLKKIGINSGLVRAKSMLLAADDFGALDRLASNRIAARKTALAGYARRKRLQAKEKRRAAKAKPQQQIRANDKSLANDNRPTERKNKSLNKSSPDYDSWQDD
jgi:hypothetical protein